MISPIEAKEIFIKKFNIDDYCSQLDESIKDYLTSDCAHSGEYAVGYLSGNIPEFVMEKIAMKYMYGNMYTSLAQAIIEEIKFNSNFQ